MLFTIICQDKPGALQTRLETRAAHLAYVEQTGIVRLAGPFIENGQMTGSLVVVEADSLADAKAWAANDPYKAAGLFESVRVSEWKKVIG